MIEVQKPKVLRYSFEEFYRMKGSPDIPKRFGDDWFHQILEKRFPKWKVLKVLSDYQSEYIYVVMQKD